MRPEDYIGERQGERVALSLDNSVSGKTYLICKCDAGHIKKVKLSHWKSGDGGVCKKCHCRRIATKHGQAGSDISKSTPAYKAWVQMRARVSSDESYVRRGIICCEEWTSFEKFLSDMGSPPLKYELDRIDGNKGYYKENCRWVTHEQNNANRTNLRMITYDGKTMCVAHWEKYLGVKPETLRKKLRFNRSLGAIMKELGYK